MKYSVVIPVYNSEDIVGQTIDRTVAFFASRSLDYEVILVNDGSTDGSWEVLKEKALGNPRIRVFDLLKNYGQHTANFCGFQHATGDYLITIDDDLQNPPEEIDKLIGKIHDGHGYDVVFGQFRQKMHASHRKIGTKVIGYINRKIFAKPKDLVLSNFRIIHRDVVKRICSYQTGYPYIPGLVLMFSSKPGNVMVEHHPRKSGKSGYNWIKIGQLVMRILFNYSSFPLRFVAGAGFVVSLICFALAVFYLMMAVFAGTSVPGWATVVVLLSFFNGMSLFVLGMLGEYLVRLINQTSQGAIYYVKEAVHE
jgi:glycosyltransferase involved in cell wall biosynthesis